MTSSHSVERRPRLVASLLIGTALGGGVPAIAHAQDAAPPVIAPAAPAEQGDVIRRIEVVGSQRIEPDTVRSYIQLRPGQTYTPEAADAALRALFDTELFADVSIRNDSGDVTIEIRENPVINRIVLEGNRRLKEDKILPEIRLAPRQIFTRSKVRADVARIIELYRRQGRFAATVEPKQVALDQNRVDIIFEITEGPKSKVRQINIIGNEQFSDGELRGEMATKQARLTSIFSSGTSYDPDRLAFDQQKLRQFYLTQGYADFRVVSAVAELTPDKRDFIITYVVEEGERYKFGELEVESEIRDFKAETIKRLIPVQSGDWYNAKTVEDTVESITETAGLLGYAFADVRPQFRRDKDTLTMNLTFQVADAPRVYVERIDINGNTQTQDKVIRREFRLNEGDAFNSFQVRRSADRINSLGFFQENMEIEQKEGSAPDRIILEANVEEKATGELQLSAGFSSLERFLVQASIAQRNFRGKGQLLRASVNYSTFNKSVELGFTEPYLFDRNIAVGGDIFRRDFSSFGFTNNGNRRNNFEQVSTGFQLRAGVPLTEFYSLQLRYGLSLDEITLDQNRFFFDGQCDPLLAGIFLCDSIGDRTTSSIGYVLSFNNTNNSLRPTAGERVTLSQDFAGLGGSISYLRTVGSYAKFWNLYRGFILSVRAEGGAIIPFNDSRGPGQDRIRINDRFFLGEPQVRGFDIRGIGPRVLRQFYVTDENGNAALDEDGNPILNTDRQSTNDDAIGGRAYYVGHVEIEIPLGAGARELGLRPSVFLDIGSVFGVTRPITQDLLPNSPDLFRPTLDDSGLRQCVDSDPANPPAIPVTSIPDGASCPAGTSVAGSFFPGFRETFVGDSAKPRLSVGFGVNWNSPFGPFRIDVARALLKEPGDDTKLFTFNVGTQF